MSDRIRGKILKRRAKFVAAALAGAGVAASWQARAQPGDDSDASTGEPSEEEAPTPPQICLSDIDIEGEVVPELEPPHPCLSAPRGDEVEPEPTEEGPPPHICLSIVPWEEGESPRTHDGWYLRGGLGPSAFWLRSDAGNATAAALSWQLAGGRTIGPGVVVGVGGDGSTAKLERHGVESRTYVWCFGPMLDVFFDPHGGLHTGLMLGPSLVAMKTDAASDSAVGAGAAVWFGYDAWVAEQLTIGGELRVTGTWTRGDEEDPSGHSVALLLTSLWH